MKWCSLALAFLAAASAAASSAEKVRKPDDVISQKRTQYKRILYPPQERGFDPSAWIERLDKPRMMLHEFYPVENLFDARSRLYAAAERLRCGFERNEKGEAAVARAYEALSRMDFAAVTNLCAEIERLSVGSESWMPFGTFNPFNWVKCFTQWGYMRAIDGCSVSEPNPWLAMWSDGFRFNLAQDERVVTANTAQYPGFYETRYLKPMTDVKFERSWTDTRWIMGDRTITFSLLTPVIDVDGVEELKLSGFPSAPVRLRWTKPNGQITSVQLTAAPPVEPEVIASAIMDFKSPPVQPEGKTCGVQRISPESVDRPYLRLAGKDWTLALFPGARPVSASWKNGVFSLRLQRRSWVGVMRLPDNLSSSEHPAMCEFFAATTLAYPESCRSVVSGKKVEWKYSYRMRTNDWGAAPRVIAPLPPILDCAGMDLSAAKTVSHPTKWGTFRYMDGASAVCTLPDMPDEPVLRGVNVSIWDKDEAWDAHVTNGANWVRAIFSGKEPLDIQLRQLEKRLAGYGGKMKFLVDPHCKFYRVDWKNGMVASNDTAFVEMWGRIADVCSKYPSAVKGYDLYNEPGIIAGSEARWRELCSKAAKAIRSHDKKSTIYHPAIFGSNPNGLFNLEPLPDEYAPQAITYHFYSPHAFTHQKTATRKPHDTCVFYPAWSAQIDWKGGTHFGGTTVDWYDRWTLGAILLPAFEHYAKYRKPMHVGEYGVVGYANGRSRHSAFLWTRDATELIEAHGGGWHLWNLGFGLSNQYVREYIYGLWGRAPLMRQIPGVKAENN